MRGGARSCDFLALWDEGAECHPLDRALGLIAAVEGISREQAATLPIDERNRALYRIAANLFGERISLIATCGDCAAETELTFSTRDALAVPATANRIALAEGAAWCRLPDSRDLAAALAAPDREKALLAAVIEPDTDDPAVLAEAEDALAAQAGLADVGLVHRCDRCGTEDEAAFDVLNYLWRRIVAEARRRLREVHIIARAYGWSSETVLALSPLRRAAHIAMIET
jgi:hypothetical protein